MRTNPTNPFRDATFSELSTALYEAVRTLEQRVFRTRVDKEAFAARLRFLLLASAMRFNTGESIPGTPEMDLARGVTPDVEMSFMEWYRKQLDRETARVRVMTLYRAADFVIGGQGAAYWVVPSCPIVGKPRPSDRAQSSDDGLRMCLRQLGALLASKNEGSKGDSELRYIRPKPCCHKISTRAPT